MNQRTINSRAFVMAQGLLDLCGNILRPEERQDAFEEFFELCRNGLTAFCIEQERMTRRLNPTQN